VRGSPLLRACIAFALLLAFAIPLRWVTKTVPVPQAAPAVTEEIRGPVTLHMQFTRPPHTVAVFHLGKEIWRGAPMQNEIEQRLLIPWPPEGIDLRLQIDWPEEPTFAAARIRLTAPDGTEYERSIWSRATADEIVSFP